MYRSQLALKCFLSLIFFLFLAGCAQQISPPVSNSTATNLPLYHGQAPYSAAFNEKKYADRMPKTISLEKKEKTIVVDPKLHAWGAYDEEGKLVRGGLATAGADFCQDEGHACRTSVGTFRVYSLGDEECFSKTYPLGKGGALMPYCIFFHNGQSLHGSPDQMLVEANVSHGCIHMRIPDVEWLRYNFARIGTRVKILPY